MPSTLVTDTGVIYAALEPEDGAHTACFSLLASGVAVAVPAPVVFEVDWLSRTRGRPRPSELLLESVLDGSLLVVDMDATDYSRALALVRQYSDLPLDLVDASVVAIAERLEETTIATLDHRHFSVVRPVHCEAFTLVP